MEICNSGVVVRDVFGVGIGVRLVRTYVLLSVGMYRDRLAEAFFVWDIVGQCDGLSASRLSISVHQDT